MNLRTTMCDFHPAKWTLCLKNQVLAKYNTYKSPKRKYQYNFRQWSQARVDWIKKGNSITFKFCCFL